MTVLIDTTWKLCGPVTSSVLVFPTTEKVRLKGKHQCCCMEKRARGNISKELLDSIENQGSPVPIAVVLLQKEEGWTHESLSEIHISKFLLDRLAVPWPQPELLNLGKSGHFRYNWSILISGLNLRKFQSTILAVHLCFGRCNWTRRKIGLIVWQKDLMQVDVEEPYCQMQ